MASGTIYGTTNNRYLTARVDWSSKATVSTNSSSVTARLFYRNSSSNSIHGNMTISITIDGNKKTFNLGDKTLPPDGKWYWAEVYTVTVAHNGNGSKSISISATGSIPGTSFSSTSLSGTATLDNIPRAATITGAPNFTSLNAPVINYSNPAGNAVTKLQACISLTGATDDVPYRDISKTDNSYAFHLTTTEMNTLKAAVTSGNSRTVYFYIKTVIGTDTYYSYLAKTFTVVDGYPTISPTAYDTNEMTVALTGNNGKIIKGYSDIYYSIGASASTGATITKQSAKCGSTTKTTSTGTFNKATSNVINFSATDSRGNNVSDSITLQTVDYFTLTANEYASLSTDGVLTYSLSGNYFNQSFGSKHNSIIVYHKFWTEDEEEPNTYVAVHENEEFVNAKLTTSGNTYTYTFTNSGLDYKKIYYIKIIVEDELSRLVNDQGSTSFTSTPVFDWGKGNFNFNVPISMPNMNGIYSKDKDGNEVEVLMPCDSVNNLRLGIGGYEHSTGATDIYGNYITLYPKHRVDINNGINLSGDIQMNGSTVLTGNIDNSNTVLAANGANVYIRPYGTTNTSGQATFYSNGELELSGNLYVNGSLAKGYIGHQKILYTDSGRYMNGSQTITLSGDNTISKQLTGYILVWLLYLNDTVYSANVNYMYIPKIAVSLYNGQVTVPLIAEDAGSIGAKTIYVTESNGTTTLKGREENGKAPNSGWVLKQVIGY